MKSIPPVILALLVCVCHSQSAWTPRQSPYRSWKRCAAVNGRFLVTSDELSPGNADVYVATSTDGVTWTEGLFPRHDGLISSENTFLFYRTDGRWWTSTSGTGVLRAGGPPPAPAAALFVRAAAWGNGVWLLGGPGFMRRSEDNGASFETRSFPGGYPEAMLFTGTEFLVLTEGFLMASADGILWTVRSRDVSHPLYHGLGTLFAGTRLSTDAGKTWTDFSPRNQAMSDVSVFADRFFGLREGRLWTSGDGVQWEEVDTGGVQRFTGLSHAGGLAIAAGQYGAIATWDALPDPIILPTAELTIKPAVELSLPTLPGKIYQLQSSADSFLWTDDGQPAAGDGGTLRFSRPSTGPRGFFRILTR